MQQRGGWVPRHPFHVGPAVVCVLLDCCSLISFPVRCAVPHSRTGGQRHLHLLRADFATGDAIHRAFEIDLVGKILMADKHRVRLEAGASSPTVLLFYISPALASSHQSGNSVFLSHHSSFSLQLHLV